MITPMHAAFAKVNAGTDGVAIHGFDVVAYFLEGRAVRGTSEFEHSWQDAKWQFSSSANKDLFATNPERYAPQYGGYCAACLALDGELADANPKAWTIVDGKLYLNYSMHQRTQWRIKSNIYVKFGDEVWTELIAREQKRGATDASYRLAVIAPDKPGADTRELLLGGDIYKAILRQPSFSITYADEPDDPSALSYLNRGGDWPYPSTNVEPSEAWQGPMRRRGHTPRFDRLYQAGRDLEVDAMLLWEFERGDKAWEFPAEIYVIDVNKQRIYKHKGTNSNIEILVRQAFDDFLAGRKQ
jgi:hypothetical protein